MSDAPWRFFVVEVSALRRLGPTFLRITFTGPELDRFADNGFDQRIKLALPETPGQLEHLPHGKDWFQRWRALPAEHRSPIRTYTVRAVRPARRELDVDIVVHEHDGGPAARWARAAAVGDRIAVLGPEAGSGGDHGGIGFKPPSRLGGVLMAGDETAVPAICAILERLPAQTRGEVLLEVPYPDDVQAVDGPAGVEVRWLARGRAAPGTLLVPAVAAAADRLSAPGAGSAPPEVAGDRELPPEQERTPLYAWLAGEASVTATLRRHLVVERGVDRGCVVFTGYWRRGPG